MKLLVSDYQEGWAYVRIKCPAVAYEFFKLWLRLYNVVVRQRGTEVIPDYSHRNGCWAIINTTKRRSTLSKGSDGEVIQPKC